MVKLLALSLIARHEPPIETDSRLFGVSIQCQCRIANKIYPKPQTGGHEHVLAQLQAEVD